MKAIANNQITDLMRAASKGDTKAVLTLLLANSDPMSETPSGTQPSCLRQAKGIWKPCNYFLGTVPM